MTFGIFAWHCATNWGENALYILRSALLKGIKCIFNLHEKGRVWSSTVSMIRRHHRPGELIFAEEFYSLDPNVWEHEIAAAGRTVSKILIKLQPCLFIKTGV